MDIKLEQKWKQELLDQFEKDYMKELKKFLVQEISSGKTIYPHGSKIFEAFNLCPFDQTKVVIIGQDPYHGPGQAHGLCFSVLPEVKPPPSLKNIYKELEADIGFHPVSHGHLESWAKQGILLLNSVLTVEHKKAGSHQGKGWEKFTDHVVQVLNDKKQNLVFILWGRYAQEKGKMIDRQRHLVLESAHPSPFSATKFFGNRHFSKTNQYLESVGKSPISWQL